MTETSHHPTRILGAFALALLIAASPKVGQSQSRPAISVIPYPASVTVDSTTRFVLGEGAQVALSSPSHPALRSLGRQAIEMLRTELGIRAQLSPRAVTPARAHELSLVLAPRDSGGAESYRLEVNARGVFIVAPKPAGLFHGLQTLRSLIESERTRLEATGVAVPVQSVTLSGLRITDAPRFSYRGLHLDAGRHFQPVAFVKRYIDLMSRYKYNTFHWHLTEDQGWRIEIKKYPRLTEVGGCRKETIVGRSRNPYVGDGIPYCGFYTQAQIREVVAYARERHITVIPEIEMPGHSLAALAAYPKLGCTAGPFEVGTKWGVEEDILCPSEYTFGFMQDVLTEVMALFPSRYIHIGGDEAPKTRWKASPVAQGVMRREKLKDEHELQSYFIRRIERFLTSRGRRLIGWDEILEGGLAPQATVMSWRGIAGGIAAARANHDVIMTPSSHTYFDYFQGDPRFEPLAIGGYLPLDTVYAYEPIPDSLTAQQAKHILGAQGQLWTEYMKTTQQMELMAYPRALALSEVLWSPKTARNWDSFGRRLLPQLLALDRLGVQNRFPHVDGLDKNREVIGDSVTVTLRTAVPQSEIRYTLDGRDPTRQSMLYRAPLTLALPAAGVTVTARAFLGDRRKSSARAATFTRRAP